MFSTIGCPITSLCVIFTIIPPLFSGLESLDHCSKNFQFRPNNIISAKKSLSLGAKFINKISVSSFKECYFWCCNTSTCTSAFWESNLPSVCFLFDCRPPAQCIYVVNNNYDSIIQETPGQNLSIKHKASLMERCDSFHICTGNKTICSDGICVCQSGWIHKKGRCVPSVCQFPELQFQCDDASACVAIYDRCNGIAECPDNSDEKSCTSDDPNPSSLFTNETSRNDRNKYHTSLSSSDLESKFPSSSDRGRIIQVSPKRPPSLKKKPTSFMKLDDFVQPSYSHISPADYRGKYSLFRHMGLETPGYEHSKDPIFIELPSESDDTVSNRRWQYPKYPGYPESAVMNKKTEQLLHPSLSEGNALNDDPPPYMRFNPRRINYHIRPYIDDMINDPHPHTYKLSSVARSRDPEYFRRGGFYEDDSAGLSSDMVDPSVFRNQPHSEYYDRNYGNSDRAHKNIKLYVHTQDHPENKLSDVKDIKESNEKENTITTPSHPTVSKASDELLSAIERSQSEGHTAALLLAFSLGLVCCFVGLLIIEWRRRQKLHKWTPQIPQSDSTIIFGGKPKVSISRPRSNRKNWRGPHTDDRRCTDEENRALCDSLVL